MCPSSYRYLPAPFCLQMIHRLYLLDHKGHGSLCLGVIITSHLSCSAQDLVSQAISWRKLYSNTSIPMTSESHPFQDYMNHKFSSENPRPGVHDEEQPSIKLIFQIWFEEDVLPRHLIFSISLILYFYTSHDASLHLITAYAILHTKWIQKLVTLCWKQSTCHTALFILMVQGVSLFARWCLALKSLGSHCTTIIKPKHLTCTFMVLNNPEVLIKMKADIGMRDPPH